jgi:hypothetical protein
VPNGLSGASPERAGGGATENLFRRGALAYFLARRPSFNLEFYYSHRRKLGECELLAVGVRRKAHVCNPRRSQINNEPRGKGDWRRPSILNVARFAVKNTEGWVGPWLSQALAFIPPGERGRRLQKTDVIRAIDTPERRFCRRAAAFVISQAGGKKLTCWPATSVVDEIAVRPLRNFPQ